MSGTNWIHGATPTPDFDRLVAGFRSAEFLPNMPAAALNLCEAIDQGEASAAELERIVLGDPSITAGVLRAANSALYGGKTNQASTIKGAIMVLGQRAVRSVAVSVWVQSLVHAAKGSPNFEPRRFSEHSMFVGFLSKYLLSAAQKTRGARSAWSPDEMFAAGVLHDVGLGLLASVDPEVFDDVWDTAEEHGWSLNEGFKQLTGHSTSELSVAAATGWKLPPVFQTVLSGFEDPLAAPAEQDALACLHYADYLAMKSGHSLCPWRIEVHIVPEIIERVGLPIEDVEAILEVTAQSTREYVAAA